MLPGPCSVADLAPEFCTPDNFIPGRKMEVHSTTSCVSMDVLHYILSINTHYAKSYHCIIVALVFNVQIVHFSHLQEP